MLRSLLHYQSSTLLGLVGIAALALSLEANADNHSLAWSPRSTIMDIGSLSSEDLIASAAELNEALNPLDEMEMSQRQMNAQWLAEGMQEEVEYYEGNEALEELAESAIKSYWDALVERDKTYDLYTPVVQGEFASHSDDGGAEYKIRLSGDTLKLRFAYTF